MKKNSRGQLLCELRQLVDEIDNNNNVAQKLYNMCDQIKTPEPSYENLKIDLDFDISTVHPILTPLVPHYHMSELLSSTFTLFLTVIQTLRQYLRDFMKLIAGAPTARTTGTQCDSLTTTKTVKMSYKEITPLISAHLAKTRVVPDLGKSHLEIAPNTSVESTLFMYNAKKSSTLTTANSYSFENLYNSEPMQKKLKSLNGSVGSGSFDRNSIEKTQVEVKNVEKDEEVLKIEIASVTTGDFKESKNEKAAKIEKSKSSRQKFKPSSGSFQAGKNRKPKVQHGRSIRTDLDQWDKLSVFSAATRPIRSNQI